jgi:D-xylulose reductase
VSEGTVRYSHGCFADAVDLVARKKIDIPRLITATYPMTKITEALEAQYKKEGIKIIIMNQE